MKEKDAEKEKNDVNGKKSVKTKKAETTKVLESVTPDESRQKNEVAFVNDTAITNYEKNDELAFTTSAELVGDKAQEGDVGFPRRKNEISPRSAAVGEPTKVIHINSDDPDTMKGGYATVKAKNKSDNRLLWIIVVVMTVVACAVGICSSVLTGYFMRRGGSPVSIDATTKYEAIAATVAARKPTVVEVMSKSALNEKGSGVITKFENGKIYILTNYHVIQNDSADVSVRFQDGDTWWKADILGFDSYFDVAVITISGSTAPYEVTQLDGTKYFSQSGDYREGDLVVAIGNAFGHGIASYDGIVSRKSEIITVGDKCAAVFRTTAAINAGMSGGGVFDTEGNLLGLGTYRMTNINGTGMADDDVEDTGYVVPMSIVYPIYRHIVTLEPKGQLGTTLELTLTNSKLTSSAHTSIGDITISCKGFGGFKATFKSGGLTVTEVTGRFQKSDEAGLKVDDVIESVGSDEKYQVTNNVCDFVGELLRYRIGPAFGQRLSFGLKSGTVIEVGSDASGYFRAV